MAVLPLGLGGAARFWATEQCHGQSATSLLEGEGAIEVEDVVREVMESGDGDAGMTLRRGLGCLAGGWPPAVAGLVARARRMLPSGCCVPLSAADRGRSAETAEELHTVP